MKGLRSFLVLGALSAAIAVPGVMAASSNPPVPQPTARPSVLSPSAKVQHLPDGNTRVIFTVTNTSNSRVYGAYSYAKVGGATAIRNPEVTGVRSYPGLLMWSRNQLKPGGKATVTADFAGTLKGRVINYRAQDAGGQTVSAPFVLRVK